MWTCITDRIRIRFSAGLLAAMAAFLIPATCLSAKEIEVNPATGTSQAVIVENSALAHTAQLLPVNSAGEIVGKGDISRQTEAVLKNLDSVLTEVKSSLRQVVKLNVYASDAPTVATIQKVIAKEFAGKNHPATCYVTGKLPHQDALVAMDAVATCPSAGTGVASVASKKLFSVKGGSQVAVLPMGSRIYVSGQAEKGTLLEATRKTMESLSKTLVHLRLNDSHIVQIKAFLTPMSSVAEVEKELLKYFAGKPAPPLVFVEWTSNIPIEIELIAAGGESKSSEAIEYITPLEMKASPVYCRAARVNRGNTVYISGLYGSNAGNGKAEVTEIFSSLKMILEKSGSDFLHLAKATYYVSENDASNELNSQRPKYYDAHRPPAASKAMVSGVGMSGKTIKLDMIAVVK